MGRVPLVTVGLPSFNHARYLPEAIESVLAQTHRPVELLIADDGSTDGSLDIARGYAARHPDRVKVFTHARRGIPATLNLALRNARGEYWCELGADDLFLADKVERQVRYLERHPDIGMLYGHAVIVDELGRALGRGGTRDLSRARDPLALLLERNCIYGQTVMIRRACFEEVGLHDETLVYSDWELWIRIAARYRIAFLPRPVARYRIHPANTSLGQAPGIQLERHLAVMQALERRSRRAGDALARPSVRALIGLQLAYLYSCAGDRDGAARAVAAAWDADRSVFHDVRFLAGWLLRRQSEVPSFTPVGGDFLAWFAAQARPRASMEGRRGEAPPPDRRVQAAVLLARRGLGVWRVSRHAWHRVKPVLGLYRGSRA